MNYYIITDGKILSTLSGPVDEADLATRGETLLVTDQNYEPGFVKQADGSFVAPVRPLDEVKSEAIEVVKQRHAETLRQLSGNASDEEMHSWPRKALAAEKYLEGTASEKQKRIIQGGADRRDMVFDAFAKLILKKAETFDDLIGQADDLKERTDAAIKAAETAEEVAAILEASEAEAAAALKQWLSTA
ncbi:putative FAD-binding dehydrogenase [Roseibium sp. TrichSKD4]|uniref:hypothetical protein n=1 Tax=Roseibium sp. TrichSKD4 TaxID=744980 RepID=UPI0001E5754F|nr:hypothetical protein [Roseibium sp. TrichSKD4]EFO29367.1 putative FAD-binding dehydrogenase [Roseibium sp. TrichSKD4]